MKIINPIALARLWLAGFVCFARSGRALAWQQPPRRSCRSGAPIQAPINRACELSSKRARTCRLPGRKRRPNTGEGGAKRGGLKLDHQVGGGAMRFALRPPLLLRGARQSGCLLIFRPPILHSLPLAFAEPNRAGLLASGRHDGIHFLPGRGCQFAIKWFTSSPLRRNPHTPKLGSSAPLQLANRQRERERWAAIWSERESKGDLLCAPPRRSKSGPKLA